MVVAGKFGEKIQWWRWRSLSLRKSRMLSYVPNLKEWLGLRNGLSVIQKSPLN